MARACSLACAQLGVSQMSAGSKTDVGGYHKGDLDSGSAAPMDGSAVNLPRARAEHKSNAASTAGQFTLQDHRALDEVVAGNVRVVVGLSTHDTTPERATNFPLDLMTQGFVPSWCTACYRTGRTGAAFMKIAKKGDIKNFCHPNSLLTLQVRDGARL